MPRPANALIIDDEVHVRVFLTAILKQLGMRTIWDASDGRTGLGQAALHKPDVVLLDLNLPEVSGIEILEKLKADNPALPVIVVSAQSTMRTIARTKELGANGYVIKYAPKSEVIQMLSDTLDAIAGSPATEVDKAGEKPGG
jgi:two-component system KDP operon response regulator KdpE